MARLCISIPVHEQLHVVVDQIENIRAFAPADTLIVLHISDGFVDNAWMQSVMPEGVYVNPASVKNDWGWQEPGYGTVLPQHQTNFRFMTEDVKEPFDYFLLEASNDLFFMEGIERYIRESGADAGVQDTPIAPPPPAGTLHAMAEHFGVGIRNSQVEGQFYRTEVFKEMAQKITSQWVPESRMIAAEEWWYPTIIQTITSNITAPYVYAPTHWHETRHQPAPVLIDALRQRTYEENLFEDVTALSGGNSDFGYVPNPENDFYNVFAIKRVPREYFHPLRTYIRGLARSHAPYLRLPKPEGFATFNACAFVEDVIANPRILEYYREDFSSSDDVALIVLIPTESQHFLPQFEQLAAMFGINDPQAGDVVAYVRDMSPLEEVLLARTVDVMITSQHLAGPLESVLQLDVRFTRRLRLLADRMLTSS